MIAGMNDELTNFVQVSSLILSTGTSMHQHVMWTVSVTYKQFRQFDNYLLSYIVP
jgi:hypothetical protein